MTQENILRPCPFCGGEVSVAPTGLDYWKYVIRHVESNDECPIGADFVPRRCRTEEETMAFWNTRASAAA